MIAFFQSILLHPLITLSAIFYSFRMVVRQSLNILVSFSSICFSAYFTITHPCGFEHISIFRRKLMSIFTMCFRSVQNGCAKTTQSIDVRSDRFNMYGVHARRTPTQMVTMERSGYNLNEHLIYQPMSKSTASLIPNAPITTITATGSPFPTRHVFVEMGFRHLNFRKNSSNQFQGYRQSRGVNVRHNPKCSNNLIMWFQSKKDIISKSLISLSLEEV